MERRAIVDFDAILERLNLLPEIMASVSSLREAMERERPEVLDYEAAAGYLKLGVTTLQQHVSAGTIPYYKIGASVRFIRSELDGWMMSKRVDTIRRRGGKPKAKGASAGKVDLVLGSARPTGIPG